MCLKFGELISSSGNRKFVWLSTLKNSARNWNCFDSATLKFFSAEKSQLAYPGPCTMLRPAVPKVPGSFICWNAALLNHSSTDFGPEFGLPTRFGRLDWNPEISADPPCTE